MLTSNAKHLLKQIMVQNISYMFSFLAGHTNNQYNTCLWKLVESGKTEKEAQEILKVLFLILLIIL